ncbi:MAG TPA: monovalent cation:proton antiporter-2 (CPA2) family protein [Rhodanobacteraceae bacterium]|nr:monovalent cation:proton antiporter-2 (CPA2) family protein [Rhodanobacteraceae bacterium]
METAHLLKTALIFLLAAVLVVPLAKRFRLGAVLGYLIAGAVIGPSGFKLVHNPDSVASVSELGVVLMLFVIGLELSPRRLWLMRRAVFGAGLMQVLASAAVIAAMAHFLFRVETVAGWVIGAGLALSSTAFGLQVLSERKELNQPQGRFAFSVLLFQDLAAIPLLALVPLLGAHASTEAIGWQGVARVIGTILVVVIGGRYLLKPLFRVVARTNILEVSVAAALLVVFGTAWLVSLAGISMALGAFLAGLLLADSEYRHEMASHIEPFEGLLLGLFFIGVGMTLDLSLLLAQPLTVLLLLGLLLVTKGVLLWLTGIGPGHLGKADALRGAALLAGGGEFAFVVFELAARQHLFPASMHRLLVLVIGLSMALTPLLVALVARLLAANQPRSPAPAYDQINDESPRVIIAGFGRVGQIVARVLRARGIPFVALENSIEQVENSRRFGGSSIYYGDPARQDLLRAAQADRAEVFVLATDDPQASVVTARTVRRMYPKLRIVARARNRQHAFRLMDLIEPEHVVRETYFSSLEMTRDVLQLLGESPARAAGQVEEFRRHDEALLKTQQLVYDDEAKLVQTSLEARLELEQLLRADSARGSLDKPGDGH